MKRINPIYLLIAFNVILYSLRGFILPENVVTEIGQSFETYIASIGVLGYLSIVAIYVACSFFFIPLLIPLNIACGALYGPYTGTAIAMAGIVLGCFASTISVRRVFTGMQKTIENRPSAQKLLAQVSRHGAIMVIAVRLAFIVPYLVQNIVLATTSIGVYRLAALTAAGSLPGAAIYSFLGAGLVQAEDTSQLALYLGIPLVLLIAIWAALKYLGTRYESG